MTDSMTQLLCKCLQGKPGGCGYFIYEEQANEASILLEISKSKCVDCQIDDKEIYDHLLYTNGEKYHCFRNEEW